MIPRLINIGLSFVRKPDLAIVCALILLMVHSASAGGSATISPQFVFFSSQDHSKSISVNNGSDESLEIWIDFKYGYNTNNDSGKITVYMPDTVQSDEPSAASWLKAYPYRFVLNAQETQVVRLVANPPPGISDGEYWARVVVTQKPLRRSSFVKGTMHSGAIQTVLIYSLPLFYRYGQVSTQLQLAKSLEYHQNEKNVTVSLPLRRLGNASYWGTVRCKISSANGNQVFAKDYSLVVFKDFVFNIDIDRAQLPPGDYTASFNVRTERSDIKNSLILHSDPLNWTLPLRVQ